MTPRRKIVSSPQRPAAQPVVSPKGDTRQVEPAPATRSQAVGGGGVTQSVTPPTPEAIVAKPGRPALVKVEKPKTTAQLIKEEVDKLFDLHGGQFHLRDLLNNVRNGEVAPGCKVHFEEEERGKNHGAKKGTESPTHIVMDWPKQFIVEDRIWTEDRTGKQYTFVQVPVNLLGVDDEVNPRHLQKPRIEKLVEAFKNGQTRFQMAQCRLVHREDQFVMAVFDGSHGTAAEILAGAKHITCKVFLPDQVTPQELFEWNTEAHSSLRQQEFRSRVLMSRRAKIFRDDFDKFLKEAKDQHAHSERGFINSLPAYERPMKLESIYDYVYAAALEDEHEVEYEDPTTNEPKTMLEPSCKIQYFVRRDEQQKRGGKQLGYDMLKSSIFKEFVQQSPSDKIVTQLPHEEWPRELERENLVRLGNILAEVMLEHKWGAVHEVVEEAPEAANGGKQKRSRVKRELTQEGALAENLWKKGPVRIWSRRLRDAIGLMLRLAPSDVETIFQRNIIGEVWDHIRQAVQKINDYGGWTDQRVVGLLGSNVVGEIERVLSEWAEATESHPLDAYYLAGQERP